MPQPPKGPRLWFRRSRRNDSGVITHHSTWVILDHGKQIGIGRSEGQRHLAESDLQRYLEGSYVREVPPGPIGQPLPISSTLPPPLAGKSRHGIIYFVTCEPPDILEFPIKIGWTIHVAARFDRLQCLMPWPIKVLAKLAASRRDEYAIHSKFEHLRLEGEWFRRNGELMGYISHISLALNASREQTQTETGQFPIESPQNSQ